MGPSPLFPPSSGALRPARTATASQPAPTSQKRRHAALHTAGGQHRPHCTTRCVSVRAGSAQEQGIRPVRLQGEGSGGHARRLCKGVADGQRKAQKKLWAPTTDRSAQQMSQLSPISPPVWVCSSAASLWCTGVGCPGLYFPMLVLCLLLLPLSLAAGQGQARLGLLITLAWHVECTEQGPSQG